MSKQLVVVGGGLFGNVAASLMQQHGWKVTVIDAQLSNRASPCAGCLFKPSWFRKLPRQVLDAAVETLDQLYGVEALEMKLLRKTITISRVQPADVLYSPNISQTVGLVSKITPGIVTLTRPGGGAQSVEYDALYLATGIWQNLDTPWKLPQVTARKGATLYFNALVPPAMKIWAPYRQSIAVPVEDMVGGDTVTWFGDGTSLKPESWKLMHNVRALEHARTLNPKLNKKTLLQTRVGLRPMPPPGEQGVFKQLGLREYLGTGGGKNGVVLAASFANRLLRYLGAS